MPVISNSPFFIPPPGGWGTWDGTNDGADQTLLTGHLPNQLTMVRVSPNIYAVAYNDDTNSYRGTIQLLQLSGTTVTAGAKYQFTTDTFVNPVIAATGDFVDDISEFIIGWTQSSFAKAAVIQFSGSSVSAQGTAITLESGTTTGDLTIKRLETNKAIATYWRTPEPNPDNFASVLTVSGTTLTQGTEIKFGRGSERYRPASDYSDGIVVLSPTYAVVTGATTHAFVEASPFTISGTTPTVGTETIVEGSTAQDREYVSLALDGSRILNVRSRADASEHLYGLIFTSSGGSVTTASSTLLFSENTNVPGEMDTVLVDTDLAMVAYKEVGVSSKIFTLPVSGTTVGSPNPVVTYSGDQLRLAPTDDANVIMSVRTVGTTLVAKLLNV